MRHQKVQRSCLIGMISESVLQIAVNGYQFQPVVQRDEDEGDEKVSHHISQNELEKVKAVVTDHPGDRDKSHP